MSPLAHFMRGAVAFFAFLALSISLHAEDAAILPAGFRFERVVSGLNYPTSFASAPNKLLFIAEKGGVVRVARNGQLRSRPFIDLSGEVNHYGDRGLTGLAIHPDFPTTPLVYLGYTYDPPGLAGAYGHPDGADGKGPRVSRVVVVEANPANDYEVAIPSSAKVLFGARGDLEAVISAGARGGAALCEADGSPIDDCIPSDSAAHGIGTVSFGPEGALYVGHGDASDPLTLDARALRAQDRRAPPGKLFRMDARNGEGLPDNPFFNGDGKSNQSKVWALGLRSPFRFTFHPVTNEVVIGDVGWNSWEEINTGAAQNFGWPCYEGAVPQPAFENFSESEAACSALYSADQVTHPIYSYARPKKGGALILGDFYTGSAYPARFRNALFFGDFNDEWIRTLQEDDAGRWSAQPFAWSVGAVVQISRGPDGDLYVLAIDRGTISRLIYDKENSAPVATIDATPESGRIPLDVRFSAGGSADPDGDALTFEWDFGDGRKSNDRNPTHRFEVAGVYEVQLTVFDAAGARGLASATISAGALPSARIESPAAGSRYAVGDGIVFQGRGIDAEGNALGEAQHRWEAILHHAGHQHPNWLSAVGKGGSFVIDDHGDDTSIELVLQVTDVSGTTSRDRVMMHPRTAPLVVESEPRGMQIVYDGESRNAPFAVHSAVGAERVVSAPAVQHHRSFDRWSDGGARSHRVRIGEVFQSITAFYENREPRARILVRSNHPEPPVLHFDGSSSSDPEGAELTYSWSFGDGKMSTEKSPLHTYDKPGQYMVVLTVSDALGAKGTEWLRVTAGPRARKRPVRSE